jgi:hypothetical protein
VRPSVLSYPYGSPESFDLTTRNCLEAAQVKYAFSYYGGYSRFDEWDPYNIPRIAIERYFTSSQFRTVVADPRLPF